ncbi:MAG: hypothetical protein AAF961_08625, partial [Planctomycetota bacterium]
MRRAVLSMVLVVTCTFTGTNARAFLPQDRWMATSAGLASDFGKPITLTWSLVPDGTDTPPESQPSRLFEFLDDAFGVSADHGEPSLRPWFP